MLFSVNIFNLVLLRPVNVNVREKGHITDRYICHNKAVEVGIVMM